jgi:hypothetical protein
MSVFEDPAQPGLHMLARAAHGAAGLALLGVPESDLLQLPEQVFMYFLQRHGLLSAQQLAALQRRHGGHPHLDVAGCFARGKANLSRLRRICADAGLSRTATAFVLTERERWLDKERKAGARGRGGPPAAIARARGDRATWDRLQALLCDSPKALADEVRWVMDASAQDCLMDGPDPATVRWHSIVF